MAQQQPARIGSMTGMEDCQSFDSQDSARISVSLEIVGPCTIGPSLSLSFEDVDGGVEPELDVWSFALDRES
jgi:hypothetical protein